jgi:ABC-type multidrug transport system ATPase subunit
VLRPGILLLDEPTANLSPGNARAVLQEYVAQVAAGGTAVLVVEQRAKEALEASARALILSGGRVSVTGRAHDLLQRHDIGRLFLGEAAGPDYEAGAGPAAGGTGAGAGGADAGAGPTTDLTDVADLAEMER